MKKVYTFQFPILFLLVIVFVSGCQIHNEKAAEEVFDKYEGREGVYTFRIPPRLIGIFLDEEEDRELKETIRAANITAVLFLY